jgi:CHAT domain-containing protein
MERFYKLHLQDGLPPVAALRRAQLWLRDELTQGQVINIKQKAIPYLEKTITKLKQEEDRVQAEETLSSLELEKKRRKLEYDLTSIQEDLKNYKGQSSVYPFAHPYYWAAFTFTGA